MLYGTGKPLVWLHGEVKTPPFSAQARVEAGYLLRMLQEGERLSMPESRPMPAIGTNCHELRVTDGNVNWRILYGCVVMLWWCSRCSKRRRDPRRSVRSTRRNDGGRVICGMPRRNDASCETEKA